MCHVISNHHALTCSLHFGSSAIVTFNYSSLPPNGLYQKRIHFLGCTPALNLLRCLEHTFNLQLLLAQRCIFLFFLNFFSLCLKKETTLSFTLYISHSSIIYILLKISNNINKNVLCILLFLTPKNSMFFQFLLKVRVIASMVLCWVLWIHNKFFKEANKL